MFVVANILLVALVIVLPLYALYIIYRPAVRAQSCDQSHDIR